jgi:4-hydroxy-3-methylbut-2-enyl diphosphate reductase
VAQTTYNVKKFQELVEIVNEKGYDICALSTICNATEERQAEAKEIAEKVDVMLVIGSKNSSNSKKLFEICKAECDNTYFIQTAEELESSVLQSIHNIGITAGASTPNKIIEEVQKKWTILNKC